MLTEPLSDEQINRLSVLALASVGDSVFDLMVRTRLCRSGTAKARDLHLSRVDLVNARAQAQAAERLEPVLTEEEKAVLRRGRNARISYIPPSASRAEYQAATALEALFGQLYLRGRLERLKELFDVI